MQEYRKVFVEVDAHFNADGFLFPRSLTWEDGTVYEIDRVLEVKRAASMKAGGIGDRYTIRVHGKTRYLWFENPRWFVAAKTVS